MKRKTPTRSSSEVHHSARRSPPPARKRRKGRRASGRTKPEVRRATPAAVPGGGIDELATNPLPLPRPSRVPSRVRLLTAPRPLHIVMVGWEWPPHHTGGLGVHCYELAKELTRLGHRITFLTPFTGPFTPVEGVTIRYPGSPEGGKPSEFPPAYWAGNVPGSPFWNATDGYNTWVANLSDLGNVDVIHVHDWFGTEGGNGLAHRMGRPLVMTVHSTEYDRSLGNPWGHILDREQRGIDAATRVIAVSRHLRQQLIDRYHADPGRIRVIYNAVRPSDRLANIDPHRRVVLFVGRLAAMKGVDTFLRAAARVVPVFPDVLFVIAGEGSEYSRLLHLTAALGIGDRVMFLGRVSEEEREILLSGASVFVLPSVVEPFGIAALEAMAAGVPTIVSKTSGVAEISQGIFHVDFWDVEEFASRIAELLEYPTLSRAMGEQGQWEALREGWSERARETVSVYLEAMNVAGRR
ncbi:MAG TPA: glycosyltransferase family 4 protein [Thermoplasmata archaeon]|nr:glycosyltransferase family 4 protein [Thermoplasmata archaeon]